MTKHIELHHNNVFKGIFAIKDMKKLVLAGVLVGFMILAISIVSAYSTVVSGTIYDTTDDYAIVPYAYVEVTCNGYTLNETAKSDGIYWVTFMNETCPINTTMAVGDICAKSGDLEGCNKDPVTVHDIGEYPVDLELGFAPGGDVFLIPEFGLVVGLITILSAVGIFFVIRRR